MTMRRSKLIVALILIAGLAGCANLGPQESVMEWLDRVQRHSE